MATSSVRAMRSSQLIVDRQKFTDRCPILEQDRFKDRADQIAEPLAVTEKEEEIIGVLDGLPVDFALAPLPGEPSCKDDL